MFGRPNIAEEGRLWIVVAGADSDVSRARPLMQPLSRGISVVGGEPRQAHALKLGGNFLISAMIHSLSEAFVYSESQGIAPEAFLEAVNSALFQSPFYAAYGKVMLQPPKEARRHHRRWVQRICACCARPPRARRMRLSLAEDLARMFEQAEQEGLGDEDWAVGQYKMAKRTRQA